MEELKERIISELKTIAFSGYVKGFEKVKSIELLCKITGLINNGTEKIEFEEIEV